MLLLRAVSACAFAPAIEPPLSPVTSIRRGTRLNARPEARFREVQRNLLARRTINDFAPTLPPKWERSLERAIEAATYAPNHKRSEPWRFYLLGPTAIKAVCELNADMVAAKKGAATGEKKLARWLKMPGWLVVTCAAGDDGVAGAGAGMEDPMGLAREDYAACCCAVQNLCLSLHAQGLGTKWTTGAVNFDARFAEAVGFAPDREFVVGTIWFGAPVQTPSPPSKKRALDDVLRRVD